ncbi:MAG TPA: hypothetical protein VF157_06195 [Chloroflexota bacterium]
MERAVNVEATSFSLERPTYGAWAPAMRLLRAAGGIAWTTANGVASMLSYVGESLDPVAMAGCDDLNEQARRKSQR